MSSSFRKKSQRKIAQKYKDLKQESGLEEDQWQLAKAMFVVAVICLAFII